MTAIKCAQHEGRNDMVELIQDFIKTKPKRERKQTKTFKSGNEKKTKIVKRKVDDED